MVEKVTKEGKARLEAELENLKNVEKPRILESLEQARNQGDLSRNADYDAARDKQRQVEERIQIIQYTLDHCVIIEEEKEEEEEEEVPDPAREYKAASVSFTACDIETKLNQMWKQGYELVSCCTDNTRCILIFKKI